MKKKHENKQSIAPEHDPSVQDRIRRRAHEISQARGGTPGRELDDWLQAEREVKARAQKSSAPPAQAAGIASGRSQ